MLPPTDSLAFKFYAKNLFYMGKVHAERIVARYEVEDHLSRMKKSIIRMSLSYSEVEKLREKILKLADCERRYARFFRGEDEETKILKTKVHELEQELTRERAENSEKVKQLTDSLKAIRDRMHMLEHERLKRHSRLEAIERKINESIKPSHYARS